MVAFRRPRVALPSSRACRSRHPGAKPSTPHPWAIVRQFSGPAKNDFSMQWGRSPPRGRFPGPRQQGSFQPAPIRAATVRERFPIRAARRSARVHFRAGRSSERVRCSTRPPRPASRSWVPSPVSTVAGCPQPAFHGRVGAPAATRAGPHPDRAVLGEGRKGLNSRGRLWHTPAARGGEGPSRPRLSNSLTTESTLSTL
jgi:hypothetical protein